MSKSLTRGFTLIELMIVVAVIGVLASVAIPQFQKFIAKSKRSEAKTNLKAIFTSVRSYYDDHGYILNEVDDALAAMGANVEAGSRYSYFGCIGNGYLGTEANYDYAVDAMAAFGDASCEGGVQRLPEDEADSGQISSAIANIDSDEFPDGLGIDIRGDYVDYADDVTDEVLIGS